MAVGRIWYGPKYSHGVGIICPLEFAILKTKDNEYNKEGNTKKKEGDNTNGVFQNAKF